LKYEEVDRPVIHGDEVLVRVFASGVNPIDWKIREGYRKHTLPFIPGWDMSGVVEEKGPDATGFNIGDEVYSSLDTAGNGSYAEYTIIPAAQLANKPTSLDHINAAAIPVSGLTAWQTLFETGGLTAGQKILILGATGGVGTFAVQFAKWKGAYVYGTASEKNLLFLSQLGADEVMDYEDSGFEENLSDTMDMILDTVGGDTQKRALTMLKPGGILVTTLQIEDQDAFDKKGVRIAHFYMQTKKEDLTAIAKLVDESKVKPVIARTFPLELAEQAHRLIREGHTRGKIVLIIPPKI
jgi:NADPH:quinone reductase-like Zn-dependent oxidoreductase